MSLRDFGLMMGVCVVWALSNIVSKILISGHDVPPLLYAAVRFMVVAAVTLPWLLPAPRPLWRVILVGLLMGGGSFAFLFLGLQTASPSAAGIVGQLSLPLTTLLSVVMLGETIRWPRRLGIGLTFVGVIIVIWGPDGLSGSIGLFWVAASAVASSFGAVIMKQIEGVRPLKLQAWVAVSSIVPTILLSAWLEPDGVDKALAAGWVFVAGVLFAALLVSVVSHTLYYGLIQRYEANLIAPLTLMTPLATIALGVAFTHDAFGLRLALGTAVALAGVLIIALRPSHMGAVRMWLKERL